MEAHPTSRPKAVLVGVKLPDVTVEEHEAGLAELERLVTTLGYETVATVTQAREHLAAAAVIGEGKLKELAELTGGTGHVGTTAPKPRDKARLKREHEGDPSDGPEEEGTTSDPDAPPKVALVAVDHEISPSQARNLERATGSAVLDRTGVIIEIFHRHAKSREARLQVEIARLGYTAPRMRESPGSKERQRGRGAGEAALELDRRKVRDRIAELKEELARIQSDQGVRRAHRKDARRVALVGYTNAGKSSLMRGLTGSEVYVEDKLFATLDTTVRALQPEAKPRILVSDTVGFIKKLPHDLVASFKSTLDEALEASHLLHVVDASDSGWPGQLEVTREVLSEIGANVVPSTIVFNKIDRLDEARRKSLAHRFPDAWLVSAHDPADVRRTRDRIEELFVREWTEEEHLIPYAQQRLVSEMHGEGRVVAEQYEADGVHVRFRAAAVTHAKFRAKAAGAS